MSGVRRHVSRGWVVLAALLVGLSSSLARAEDVRPGDEFLRLIDAKQYAESWGAASDYFRHSVSQADWTRQVQQAREPLGAVVSRELKSSEPQKNPPGAPAGDYLLLTFQTRFADSEPVRTETLPLIKSADGRWRAVGYFLR